MQKEPGELDKIVVPSSTLEALFGVADRTVRHLADEGIVKRDSKGKYLLWESAKNYITALKVARSSRGRVETEDGEYDLDSERALHEHVKRQITDIKLQLIKGQVHKSEDVERVMTNMFERFKSKMTALPSKLANRLVGKSRTQIQAILKAEIDAALTELADYSPTDFYSDEHIEVSDDDIEALGVDEYDK
jgi:phage terminase Nu1 subunit (DNA packaging protein)